MRITKVSVKKLFGVFDHVITLNHEEHITIIHGPNGIGKTILLKMIDGLFSGHYGIFRQVPFEAFQVELDNNEVLTVNPPTEKRDSPILQVRTQSGAKPIPLKGPTKTELDEIQYYLFRRGSYEEFFIPEAESLEDAILGLPPEVVPSRFREDLEGGREARQLIEEYGIQTRFIQAQRLQTPLMITTGSRYLSSSLRRKMELGLSESRAAVEQYSDDLVDKIDRTLTEYANRSQSLDKTFPDRLIDEIRTKGTQDELPGEEIVTRLKNLDETRQALVQAGLLEPQESITAVESMEPALTSVLSVYIQDVEEKFAVFDELRGKIEILTDIINTRFLNKKMQIKQRQGFVFIPTISADAKPLSASDLSSGEQHQLVLFYELLFKVDPGSFILIDEPELSLHIAWQNQFLNDLGRIVKAGNFDVVIATHSPDIIYDRWDLTVDLVGEEDIE